MSLQLASPVRSALPALPPPLPRPPTAPARAGTPPAPPPTSPHTRASAISAPQAHEPNSTPCSNFPALPLPPPSSSSSPLDGRQQTRWTATVGRPPRSAALYPSPHAPALHPIARARTLNSPAPPLTPPNPAPPPPSPPPNPEPRTARRLHCASRHGRRCPQDRIEGAFGGVVAAAENRCFGVCKSSTIRFAQARCYRSNGL